MMSKGQAVRLSVLAVWFVTGFASPVSASEGTFSLFPALKPETERLQISGAMDTAAIAPLIRDFQKQRPDIAVAYNDRVTNDLYEDADAACMAKTSFADVILSSSVDHLVKLANDGCARSYQSQYTVNVPEWTQWRNEVYGFTFEPAVLVYNSDYVAPDEMAATHGELADLLRRKNDYYFRRVGTYDLRTSGIGYLLAFLDAQQASATYGRLLESMSRTESALYCCNNDVLRRLESGELYIGYNILGSYAYAAQKRNPKLRITMMRDYTHILSRGVLLPRYAKNYRLGESFLDYLLSPQGKAVALQEGISFPWDGVPPSDINAPGSLLTSGIGRPIRIGPSLLAAQDQMRRQRFIGDWQDAMLPASLEP